MANGSAAVRLLESPSAPAAADKPGEPAIEILGEAVAEATIMLCQATLSHRHAGVLDPAIKDAGASSIARVARWQLDHELGDNDFIRKARDAGKRVLLHRHFTDDRRAEVDAAIEMFIDELLTIVGHVVKDERTLRAAWAN